MNEFKGTKGKWVIKSSILGVETEIFCGKIRVAQSKHYNNGKEGYENFFINDPLIKEGKANAKLIAAAPELLKALLQVKEILKRDWPSSFWDDFANKETSINKAINKALN